MSKVCGCDGSVLAENEQVAAEGIDDRSSRREWEIKGRQEEREREREREKGREKKTQRERER